MAKGQLISKGLFAILNSSKKQTKKFDLTTMIHQVDLFSFVFWKNLKIPKRLFEINWLLPHLAVLGSFGQFWATFSLCGPLSFEMAHMHKFCLFRNVLYIMEIKFLKVVFGWITVSSSGNSVIAFPYCEYPEPYLQSRKEVNTYTTYLVFIVETFSSDIDVVIPKLRLF